MSVVLIAIATGEAYQNYVIEMIASANEFWPTASTLVFTDFPQQMAAHSRVIHTEPKGFPEETLLRYHTFLKAEHELRQWDHIFYVDADMKFVAPIKNEEVVSDGITATLHPGFVFERTFQDTTISTFGTPERSNIQSKAYIPEGANNKYFCGGFNGGTTGAYLEMARTIKASIEADRHIFGLQYAPIWHDESYMNRYLYDNPPAKIISPSYCYPEGYQGEFGWLPEQYEPKLLALNKRKKR